MAKKGKRFKQTEFVRWEGLNELLDILQKRWPKEFNQMLYTAMRFITFKVQGWARKNAPVDTGRLRASLVPGVEPIAGGIRGWVGSPVQYAPYVETSTGSPRGVGRIPFLKPAIEEHVEEIIAIIERYVNAFAKKLGF